VDWNVPLDEGEVRDDFRIKATLPTIKYLEDAGAKVIIATHLEPGSASVEPLRKYVPEGAELLENLRANPGEKNNDDDLARFLAAKADIFVNEAFSASHREHASIVGIPKFLPSFAGLRFIEEVRELSKAFNPSHPFLLILGGAKLNTKLPLVERFLNIADQIFIGGTLAPEAADMPLGKNPKVFLPHGDITALDVDEETIEDLKSKIGNSEFVVWNGPLGKYEDEEYQRGTKELARILSESGKEVIVGGGDTLAAIQELDVYDKFSFVSTGGGAMLDFLATGTLPGIEALKG
jgi:phosphoglycerate kinase